MQLLPGHWGIVIVLLMILVLRSELIGQFEFIASSLVVAEEAIGLLKNAL